MTMNQKIQKATDNFDLSAIEIRKIYSAAKRRNKGRMVELESWYSEGTDEWGFRKVECHIFDPLNDERLDDLVIFCCLFDRRKSWVA